MIIVKSTFGKLELDNSALTSIQDTTDGIYARTKDGSEFRIASSPLPQLKVLSHMIMNMNSKDKNLVVDLLNSTTPISIS